MRLERLGEADAMPRRCSRLWPWLLGLSASAWLALYLIFIIIERTIDAALKVAFAGV
jgi:hypothetical protein